MEEDLVQRLKDEAAIVSHDDWTRLNPLLIEAAAEIERLRSGKGYVINMNAPVTINGTADKGEIGRTMYQVGQNLARRLQSAR